MNAPLDADLATIDTSLPLLAPDQYYDMRVEKAEIKPAAGESMLSLDMVTVAPAKSNKGQDLGAGVHVFDNLMLAPTGKATWDMINRNVGSLVQAAQLPPPVAIKNAAQWAPQLVGRVLRVKIGYAPAGISPKNGKQFKEKNEVLLYTKPQ